MMHYHYWLKENWKNFTKKFVSYNHACRISWSWLTGWAIIIINDTIITKLILLSMIFTISLLFFCRSYRWIPCHCTFGGNDSLHCWHFNGWGYKNMKWNKNKMLTYNLNYILVNNVSTQEGPKNLRNLMFQNYGWKMTGGKEKLKMEKFCWRWTVKKTHSKVSITAVKYGQNRKNLC